MNELAKMFLEETEQSKSAKQRVTTTLEGELLELVEKWRGTRSFKEAVGAMIRIADRALTEEMQARS